MYFHRVERRKIEHVYCSVYSSPFHSHSCVNMTELQFQTVCMCVCQLCKRRGNNKVNAPLNKDVDMVCVNTTGPLPWLQIVIYECKDLSGLPWRPVCSQQLPGHQADGLAGRCILHCMNLVKLSETNCSWWVATEDPAPMRCCGRHVKESRRRRRWGKPCARFSGSWLRVRYSLWCITSALPKCMIFPKQDFFSVLRKRGMH